MSRESSGESVPEEGVKKRKKGTDRAVIKTQGFEIIFPYLKPKQNLHMLSLSWRDNELVLPRAIAKENLPNAGEDNLLLFYCYNPVCNKILPSRHGRWSSEDCGWWLESCDVQCLIIENGQRVAQDWAKRWPVEPGWLGERREAMSFHPRHEDPQHFMLYSILQQRYSKILTVIAIYFYPRFRHGKTRAERLHAFGKKSFPVVTRRRHHRWNLHLAKIHEFCCYLHQTHAFTRHSAHFHIFYQLFMPSILEVTKQQQNLNFISEN